MRSFFATNVVTAMKRHKKINLPSKFPEENNYDDDNDDNALYNADGQPKRNVTRRVDVIVRYFRCKGIRNARIFNSSFSFHFSFKTYLID